MHKVSYISNGIDTEYVFDFKWFQKADVRVAVGGVMLGANQYAVEECALPPEYETPEQAAANDTGVHAFFGGRIVLAAPTADGAAIEIQRKISLTGLVSFQRTERITPEKLNLCFDQLREHLRDMDNQ